jgi:hypothetical protein
MTRRSLSIPFFAAVYALGAIACSGAVEPGTSTTGSSSGTSGGPGMFASSEGASASGGGGGVGSSSGPATQSPSCTQGTPCADFFNPTPPGATASGAGGFGCGTLPHEGDLCTTSCTCDSPTGYLQCTEECPTGIDAGVDDGGPWDPPESTLDSGATTACVPGQSIACTGPGGCVSNQVCNAAGTGYGACMCSNDGAPLLCVPGQSIACTGPGGCFSNQVCESDGMAYGPCVCSDAGSVECDTASDCTNLLGPVPQNFCPTICPDGSHGCAHYECVTGICQTTYCD